MNKRDLVKKETILGVMSVNRLGTHTLARIKNVRWMFDLLLDSPTNRPELAAIMGLSESGVRKTLAVFEDAKVLCKRVPKVIMPGHSTMYYIDSTSDAAKSFDAELDRFTAEVEAHIAGKQRIVGDVEGEPVEPKPGYVRNNMFTSYEYEPGRRLYCASDDVATSVAKIDRTPPCRDPMLFLMFQKPDQAATA